MRGSATFETLVTRTANDGSYTWFIPPTFRPYEFYRIAIAYSQNSKAEQFQYSYSPYFEITVATNPPTHKPTARPTARPTPKPSSQNMMKSMQKDESLIHHDETLVKSWYKHNKQDAAAFIGGVAGLVVIGSFYSLMTAVRTSPSVSGAGYDAGSGNLGYNPEESVGLTGKRGSTDV
jgi:hypothetical protein